MTLCVPGSAGGGDDAAYRRCVCVRACVCACVCARARPCACACVWWGLKGQGAGRRLASGYPIRVSLARRRQRRVLSVASILAKALAGDWRLHRL